MRARELLGPEGPFAKDARYEHRPGQLEMADAVERALDQDRTLLVEAGTGTGKTLAYLVPALLSGRKVVVSTGTRALQDQIMAHDVPILEAALGRPLRVACMKGLSNYVCRRRLEEFRTSAEAISSGAARHLPAVLAFAESSYAGDRAELDEVPEDAPIWPLVTSASETRIGPPCRFHESCFVTRMRRDADDAELVVVNHHLFFADLATRGDHGGGVLPRYDAVVFDEAHQLEDAATSFFGVAVSTARVIRLARDAERALAAGERDLGRLEAARRVARSVTTTAEVFFLGLSTAHGDGNDANRRELPRGSIAGETERRLFAFDDALAALAAMAENRQAEHEAIAALARRTNALREDLATVAEGSRGSRVAWFQRAGGGAILGASPIDVGDLLRDRLFESTPAVLTSATLTTSGHFEFLKSRLGIARAEELVVPSPFDYPTQAGLYLTGTLPDPRDPAYDAAAFDEVDALVTLTGGGAFVLCTSLRRMRTFAAMARSRLRQQVLVQNEMPKPALLARFREDGHAVLFATASFWEGVDVPGDALRLVVLEKLPFDVPSDPLVAARCERLRERGESPFSAYLLPSAAIALKQGFGRLIRTRRDRGLVAVLDPRIVTKPYGRTLLRSLPDASRCHSLDEAAAFVEQTRGGHGEKPTSDSGIDS